ncbi:MAG TPA: hypothetical protein PK624_10260 [Spirochaetota bacterium]|nr:hypothetical protein [Spirochaetota bacterium]HOR45164.1 hypothetical protein [Spirochaetota bacterium]HOU85109.1 hypothetical protein [Spirochaetota bacterium]HPK56653.1 hypothetical protein [Spirochaetota bacterium]HPM35306.1 hypothetical protein [Spirochaetota bacterium]
MNDFHKKMLNDILGRGKTRNPDPSSAIIERDKLVRKSVADLYSVLSQSNQPDLAVKLLADHVAIMVDMINEFKSKGRG